MRDIFEDDEEIKFEIGLLGIMLVFVGNKTTENIPAFSGDVDSEAVKNFYAEYCGSLDKKTFKAYKKSLKERLENLPDDIVYPFGDEAKKREVSMLELKCYDALRMYAAKTRHKRFDIDKGGNVRIGVEVQGIQLDVTEGDDELQDISDEYYVD